MSPMKKFYMPNIADAALLVQKAQSFATCASSIGRRLTTVPCSRDKLLCIAAMSTATLAFRAARKSAWFALTRRRSSIGMSTFATSFLQVGGETTPET
ncbi:hypothetical protein EJB05_03171 [Eragrostis curvula]|uniref:Uncharacterized protein n=1 Tax=Eragrostis curvula TaxID=38414 RepID=A0A5J9WU61_9POAL|nr:hypothetical protein EJB05_03171 [Eragrostis curvula]